MKESEVIDFNAMTKLEKKISTDKEKMYSEYHHFHNAIPAPKARAAAESFAVEFIELCNRHLTNIKTEKIRM